VDCTILLQERVGNPESEQRLSSVCWKEGRGGENQTSPTLPHTGRDSQLFGTLCISSFMNAVFMLNKGHFHVEM
jgi:hypothetical protein